MNALVFGRTRVGRAVGMWAMGLAAWLTAHGAAAQDRGVSSDVGGTWSEVLTRAGVGGGIEVRTLPEDRDLVRAGVFARWTDALAGGTTSSVNGAADLDGDGGLDRLLTVAPCADPYPFNESTGLVLVRSEGGGFRATVLCRDGCGQGERSWRVELRRGRPLVTLAVRWSSGHASDGFGIIEERHRFRLTRDGTLHHVETCHLGWQDGEAPATWGTWGRVAYGSGRRCQ